MQPADTEPPPDGRPVREGVVVVVQQAERFLVIRRAPNILAGGAWCFVGGSIEPGEAQADAAAREFAEEVGGLCRPLARVWEYVRPDGRLLLHWWWAEFLGGELRPQPAEVSEIRWCSAPELLVLPNLLESNRAFLAALASGDVVPPPV